MSEIATQSLVPVDITLGSGIESHATALFMETTNVISSLIEDGGTFSAESTTIIYDDNDDDDDEAELIQAGSATFEVPFFVALLIFGGIGNLMVVAVYTRKKYKNSNAALHILNLAAGDLFLLIVVVGLHISEYYYQTWFILWRSDIQCILHRFARFVGFNLTVFEMMAIAIDRYLAVCFPLRFKAYCTPGQTKLKIFLLWILALLTAIPVVLNFATKYGIPLFSVTFVGKTPFACRAVSGFPEFYDDFKIIYISIILFFIPIVITAVIYVIIVAYVRSNNQKFTKINSYSRDTSRMRSHWKTARTLLAAFTCYAACYVLLATYTLVRQYSPAAITPTMKNIGLLLPYANSCMNPVVYSVVNRQFRRDFVALFPCVQGSSSTGNTRTDRGINGNTRTDRGINESTTIATTLPDDSGMNTASLSKETATNAAPCSSISYDVFVKETITKEDDHGDRGVVHISTEEF